MAGSVKARRDAGTVAWFGKPAGMPYADLLARTPSGELWQRKLTLSPAPEFCLSNAGPPGDAEDAIVLEVKLFPTE